MIIAETENVKKIKVLQFASSQGLFGAERWILMLAKYSPRTIEHIILVIKDSPDGQAAIIEQASKMGFDSILIEAKGSFDLSVIKKISVLVKEKQIDIIHTHGYKSDIIGLIVARYTSSFLVSTPHGFGSSTDLKSYIYKFLGVQSQKLADKVVPLSDDLKNYYISVGISDEKLITIKNAVDISEAEEKQPSKEHSKYKSENNIKLIGYIGRLAHGKGISFLVDAMKNILDKVDAKLIIIGDGPLKENIEQQIKNLKLENKIELLGFREDRIEIMKCFDVFVLPSLSEGIPRVIMEAMSAKVPVVSTKIPGVTEIIENGVSGILVSPGSTQQLAEVIVNLLTNSSVAAILTSNAYYQVQKEYSAEIMAKKYANLFSELLRRPENENCTYKPA